MTFLEQLHQAHAARRQAWNAMSVADEGIDLKRLPRGVTARDVLPSSNSLRFVAEQLPVVVPVAETTPDPVAVPVRRIEFPEIPNSSVLAVRKVVRIVAEYRGLTRADIMGRTRTKDVARARHDALYIAHTVTRRSYPWLGHQFAGRDHTTALYAIEKTRRLACLDFDLGADLASLECVIRNRLK